MVKGQTTLQALNEEKVIEYWYQEVIRFEIAKMIRNESQ